MNFLKFGLIILTFSIISSCEDSTTGADDDLLGKEITKEQDVLVLELLEINYSTFTLPPPVDLFISMWEMELNFSKEAVNSPDNLKNYNTSVRKAIGLGAFSSDLSYTSVYGQNQLTKNYFSVSKKLADDLGLTKGFDKEIVQRINDNIGNADSLYNITKDSYSDAITQVNSSGQAHLLPYILYGGWLESIYIAAIAGDANKADEVSINTFSGQGVFIETLIDYYKHILESVDVKVKEKEKANAEAGIKKEVVVEGLDDIKAILADLETIYKFYEQALESDDLTLTEEQFSLVKNKIIVIREKWLM